MTKWAVRDVSGLHDPVTGALVGFLGSDGREYLHATSLANSTSQPVLYIPSALSVTGGAINGTAVGPSVPSTGSFTSLRLTSLASGLTDGSGTPGNVNQNVAHGRAAFPAAASSVVVTNPQVTAASSVFVQLGGTDATLTAVRVTTAAGSFTVTGNAASTGITPFDYLVIQN